MPATLAHTLAAAVLGGTLLGLWLWGTSLTAIFMERIIPHLQGEESCRAEFVKHYGNETEFPGMPSGTFLTSFRGGTVAGIVGGLVAMASAWVLRRYQGAMCHGAVPPGHFTFDGFAQTVIRSRVYITWGILTTFVGIVGGSMYIDSRDTGEHNPVLTPPIWAYGTPDYNDTKKHLYTMAPNKKLGE